MLDVTKFEIHIITTNTNSHECIFRLRFMRTVKARLNKTPHIITLSFLTGVNTTNCALSYLFSISSGHLCVCVRVPKSVYVIHTKMKHFPNQRDRSDNMSIVAVMCACVCACKTHRKDQSVDHSSEWFNWILNKWLQCPSTRQSTCIHCMMCLVITEKNGIPSNFHYHSENMQLLMVHVKCTITHSEMITF